MQGPEMFLWEYVFKHFASFVTSKLLTQSESFVGRMELYVLVFSYHVM